MKRPIPFTLIVFFFCLVSGFARLAALDVPSVDFPDSSDIRSHIQPIWLTGELNPVRLMKPVMYRNLYGDGFVVSQKTDKSRNILSIMVSPAEKKGFQGDWILWRHLSDGMPDHISIYPVPDRNIRIDLRPAGSNPEAGRSTLDLVIYGALAIHEAPVGIPFINLYSVSFSSIVSLTEHTVPWNLLDPDAYRYRDIIQVAGKIRDSLKTLVSLDDGVFNEKGEAVLLKDGSPQNPAKVWESLAKNQKPADVSGGVSGAGFVKWIVDGIVRPVAGEGTRIDPLLTPTAAPENNFTDPARENGDLFFTLDWTRNLASAVVTLDRQKAVKSDTSGVDVTSTVFSGSLVYEKNVGYKTSEILPLLYWLAVREPGHMYLGAISRQQDVPPMRHFYDAAAFLPYFDQNGQFAVAVFENAHETPVSVFLGKNNGNYINLVRIRVPEATYFEP